MPVKAIASHPNGGPAPLVLPQNFGGLSPLHQQEREFPRGWIVHKYGGTAVGKMPEGIADIVKSDLELNNVAVVCSARSTRSKHEGTTNRLLLAAREAEKPNSNKYIPIVETMRKDHIVAATQLIRDAEILGKLEKDINGECDNLVKILESANHLEEVSTRVQDKIVSKGEKLSCLYMTAILQDKGLGAVYVDVAEILASASSFASSTITPTSPSEDFYIHVARTLGSEIEAVARKGQDEGVPVVPVITGFFGAVPGGLLNSIGRGYTDLCAALVALGLGADELQIWKEIAGVYTADPNKVAGARLLSSISPSEAAELTFYGSEVIHPFTMEQVIRARIPIRIKNVLNPRAPGTVILPDAESVEVKARSPLVESKLFRTRSPAAIYPNGSISNDRRASRPKRPTAVTVKPNIVILHVHSNKKTRAHGFLRHIFEVLDSCHLSVDLLSSSEVAVSCALHSDTVALLEGESGAGTPGGTEVQIASEDLRNAVRDLSQIGTIDIVPNMAIISLVGKELRRMTGISGRFLSTLGANNINVEMISQGASEMNISCVIDNRVADRALNVVHTNLFTFLD